MIQKIGCIEIPVSTMEKSVDFYENVLGLKKTYEHPVWTSFDIEGISFALAASGTKGSEKGAKICKSCSPCVLRFSASKTEQEKETPTATSVIYLAVENLNSIYRKLREKGAEFVAEPREQAWGGMTVVMLDPDRNILVLTQYE